MLELICDHSYTWQGLPADKSPYRNHGGAINTDGAYDGSEPGSGVITFPHPNSRIRIASGPAWQPLTALKIEVVARVDARAARSSVLVAGHGAFRFGLMEGALEAQFVNSTGRNNYVRSADAFAPGNKYFAVPANRWVTLSLHHDGFARMRLFIDGELVGEATIEGGVPPVKSFGVSIGNDVDQDDSQFPGEIDEVRIWRLDPKAMKREFLGRPYTPQTAQCWEERFKKTFDWLREHPEKRRVLAQEIETSQRSFLRSLFLLPVSDQARLRAVYVAFADLWAAGRISGAEMEKVLCDWVAALRALGLDPSGGPVGPALADCGKLEILGPCDPDCDPASGRFLALLGKALEGCGKKAAATQ